jgi:hypothetical protein
MVLRRSVILASAVHDVCANVTQGEAHRHRENLVDWGAERMGIPTHQDGFDQMSLCV